MEEKLRLTDEQYHRSFYRGYTPAQLDAMIDREQQFHRSTSAPPVQIIPPALFTPEMLGQIRTVVREELRTMLLADERIYLNRRKFEAGVLSLEEYQAEAKAALADISTDDSSPVHVVRKELSPEQRKQIVEDVKRSISRDVRLSSGRTGF